MPTPEKLVAPEQLMELCNCGRKKAFKIAREIGPALYNQKGEPMVRVCDYNAFLARQRSRIQAAAQEEEPHPTKRKSGFVPGQPRKTSKQIVQEILAERRAKEERLKIV